MQKLIHTCVIRVMVPPVLEAAEAARLAEAVLAPIIAVTATMLTAAGSVKSQPLLHFHKHRISNDEQFAEIYLFVLQRQLILQLLVCSLQLESAPLASLSCIPRFGPSISVLTQ